MPTPSSPERQTGVNGDVGDAIGTTVVQPSGDLGDDSARLEASLDVAIVGLRRIVEADVERVRRRRPGLSPEELAQALVKRGVRRVGAMSFATGFGGAPVLAANITSVLTLQTGTVLTVAAAYDELNSPDLRQDLLLILAGKSAVTALRGFGVAATNDIGKRWVEKNVTRETMKQVNKVVSRKILTKAGEKSLTSFVKLVPVAGATVGYVVDRSYTRVLGERAIRYYSGK